MWYLYGCLAFFVFTLIYIWKDLVERPGDDLQVILGLIIFSFFWPVSLVFFIIYEALRISRKNK